MPGRDPSSVQHLLCVLILIARIGDVGTTWLATPNLKLEANDVVRRLRWPFAIATLFVCFLPYVHAGASVSVLVASLLVSAANASKLWAVRAMGEDAYLAWIQALARKTTFTQAAAPLWAGAAFVALVGVTMLVFYSSDREWGF